MIWNTTAKIHNHITAAFGHAIDVRITLKYVQMHFILEQAVTLRNWQTLNGRGAVCAFWAQADECLHSCTNRFGLSIFIQKIIWIMNENLCEMQFA